ncbi:hypothetical protein NUU61_003209 [Penicillium alfredii]|uniref:Uncharacterized protein n=1 Tax=Penicillium alfredii TaxID=1506179 RepID=A0A9W9FU66_9EURO|nr:uncharacterized protein NUU61_003209 [Penicillium alfredii]KAJ5105862.1 hypothetical protein NUU61_003209 [Penicillium alfredii]
MRCDANVVDAIERGGIGYGVPLLDARLMRGVPHSVAISLFAVGVLLPDKDRKAVRTKASSPPLRVIIGIDSAVSEDLNQEGGIDIEPFVLKVLGHYLPVFGLLSVLVLGGFNLLFCLVAGL